jgi:hypothetical protein
LQPYAAPTVQPGDAHSSQSALLPRPSSQAAPEEAGRPPLPGRCQQPIFSSLSLRETLEQGEERGRRRSQRPLFDRRVARPTSQLPRTGLEPVTLRLTADSGVASQVYMALLSHFRCPEIPSDHVRWVRKRVRSFAVATRRVRTILRAELERGIVRTECWSSSGSSSARRGESVRVGDPVGTGAATTAMTPCRRVALLVRPPLS